jgi:hypothetical protein
MYISNNLACWSSCGEKRRYISRSVDKIMNGYALTIMALYYLVTTEQTPPIDRLIDNFHNQDLTDMRHLAKVLQDFCSGLASASALSSSLPLLRRQTETLPKDVDLLLSLPPFHDVDVLHDCPHSPSYPQCLPS